MDKSIIQIENLDGFVLLGSIEGLTNEVKRLQENFEKQPKPTDFLTRADVGNMFNVSLVTVSDWTAKGILKAYKLANRVYYKRADIEQALTEIHPKR